MHLDGFGSAGGGNASDPRSCSVINIVVGESACFTAGAAVQSAAKALERAVVRALSTFPLLRVQHARAMPWLGQATTIARTVGAVRQATLSLTFSLVSWGDAIEFAPCVRDLETGQRFLLSPVLLTVDDLRDETGFWVEILLRDVHHTITETCTEKALAKQRSQMMAIDHYLIALDRVARLTHGDVLIAEGHLEEAIDLNPRFATALAWLARLKSIYVGQDWTVQPELEKTNGWKLMEKALEMAPLNPIVLATAGHMRSFLFKDFKRAREYLELAMRICPFEPLVWLHLGMTLTYDDEAEDGREMAVQACQMAPHHRLSYLFWTFTSCCYYGEGNYAKAVEFACRSLVENPRYTATIRMLVKASVGDGELVEARGWGRDLLHAQPRFVQRSEDLIPFSQGLLRERCFRHLESAGVVPPRRLIRA